MTTRRVRDLEKKGVLQSVEIKTGIKGGNNKEKIIKAVYLTELGRPYSLHDLQAVNLYAELKLQGAINMKIDLTPQKNEYAEGFVPDALIECTINGKRRKFYFEAEDNHETRDRKIRLYERLHEKEKFDLVMSKDNIHCTNIKVKSSKINIIKLEFNDYSNIQKFI